jgi:hypothetical protein
VLDKSVVAELQAVGKLELDAIDSEGASGRRLHKDERLMALTPDGGSWYGFIILDMQGELLVPGDSAHVGIAFLDDQGARKTFAVGEPFRFGNGVRTRGSITLKLYV